jgi:hypothetical protein
MQINMKNKFILSLLLLFNQNIFCQVKNINDFLIKDRKQTEVLLLGVFHFEYYNADSHKTDSINQIDILASARQKEILKIVNAISKFKPTIICLESSYDSLLNNKYSDYLSGKYTLSKDEIDQLGYRIAEKSGIKKVFGVDAKSWFRDNLKKDNTLEHFWDEQYYLDTLEMNHWSGKYTNWLKYLDSISTKLSLKEYLKLLNQPKVLDYTLGQYLVEMKTSNHNGPDFVTLDWYNRNLRIFNNILKTNPTETDRILVIFGSGHIPVLKHYFQSSPQFKVISINKYLK